MGTSLLEALSAEIDELLALDPDESDDDELHDIVVELLRQSHRLAAARARLISLWDRRPSHQDRQIGRASCRERVSECV